MLEELLKRGGRLDLGTGRWLVWDDMTSEWVVYSHAYRAKYTKREYSGVDLAAAIKSLEEG